MLLGLFAVAQGIHCCYDKWVMARASSVVLVFVFMWIRLTIIRTLVRGDEERCDLSGVE